MRSASLNVTVLVFFPFERRRGAGGASGGGWRGGEWIGRGGGLVF